jgi:hypothetical protein
VIRQLLDQYAFTATRAILEKVRQFTSQRKKKLLVVNFDHSRSMRPLIQGNPRADQTVVDFLRQENFLYFDMNLVHVEDFKNFSIPLDQYLKRYFIGHYSPAGNHFFAYSIKNTVVDWLDPKPVTYQDSNARRAAFDGYLPR